MIKRLIILFLIWRLLLFVPLFIGDHVVSYREGSPYTRIWKFTQPYFPVNSTLLYPWANFDGVHYLAIAGEGYSANGRFFPLYPLTIYLAIQFLGGSSAYGAVEFFTALFLSNVFFLLALIVFYKLIRIDYSKKIAEKSIFFLLIFPTAFFFAGIFSESLFLLLALCSFYFARRKLWLAAGVMGLLLSATRLVGIFILPALILEFYIQNKGLLQERNYKKILGKSLPLLLIPLGLLAFAIYSNFKWHDPLNYIHTQGILNNGRSVSSIVFPLQTLFRYAKIFLTLQFHVYEWWIAMLELSMTVFAGIVLVIGWRQKIRPSYLLFAGCCYLLPILSGTLSGMPRYTLILFPAFIAIANINSKKFKIVFAIICILFLFLLTFLFSKGYFIA